MIIYRFDSAEYPLTREPPALNDVPAGFVRDITRIGCPGLLQPTKQEQTIINEQLEKVWKLIGDTMREYPYPVVGVYLYDDYSAEGEYCMADGMCSNQASTENTPRRAIIGIGRSAVNRGSDYLAFLLLHEIAHAAAGIGHDDGFHQYLDYLIMSYNHEYGTELKNDYLRDA